jgi:hypothetical protein
MEAKTLLQSWLDRMSVTVLTDDWATYSAHVCLPFRLVTETGDMLVATETELRRGFDGFVAALRSQNVTDYIRLATSARQPDPGRLEGAYETHTLSHGQRVLPTYRSAITLQRQGDAWRATAIANTLNNDRWPIDVPGVTPTL